VSHVNLLPREILEAQRWRRVTFGVGVVGAFLLVVLFGFYLLQTNTLGGVRADIDDQNATNASIQASIDDKQKFADLQAEAQSKQALLAVAYQGEVSFASMLMDLSRVVPSDAYLDNLAAQLTETQADVATASTGLVGSITLAGKAVSIDSVSVFLTRLEQVKGWVNPWAGNIAPDTTVNGVQYGIQVDLSTDVVTERGKGAVDAAG
jgi:Tfp pilus assembly protein PilN